MTARTPIRLAILLDSPDPAVAAVARRAQSYAEDARTIRTAPDLADRADRADLELIYDTVARELHKTADALALRPQP